MLKGRWALVTGASSGLGCAFARVLAARGCNLVLVARRADRLEQLVKELESAHPVRAFAIPADLTEADAPHRIHRELGERGLIVDVLINNAGAGLYGAFHELGWERQHHLLALDVVALTNLTHLFVRDMVVRRRGWVLQVASIAAHQPSPSFAVYAAAKTYVLNLAEALCHELEDTGVTVGVISPPAMQTEFLELAGLGSNRYLRWSSMASRRVAESGIRALLAGRRVVVPGPWNAAQVFLLRFVSRRLAARLAARFLRPS